MVILVLWVVSYGHPKFPGGYMVQRQFSKTHAEFCIGPEIARHVLPTDDPCVDCDAEVVLAPSLEAARSIIPPECGTMLTRSPGDKPWILEIWF